MELTQANSVKLNIFFEKIFEKNNKAQMIDILDRVIQIVGKQIFSKI